jgi:solute carrier family 35 (adenosine 3'-phospho 5'-phosphosulfate transporter), member B3
MKVKSSSSKFDDELQPEDRRYRFLFLVVSIMTLFGMHNYMQELIMNLPGFDTGVFLGYLEVLGVTLCTSVERQIVGDTGRRASWGSYAALCVFLIISSATSNIALNYINYPTKVVFRSCKLIPTMIIAVVFNKKKIQNYEFGLGAFVSLGMVLFAVADFKVSPNFNVIGLVLVCVSVVADAFLPNFQEKIFEQGSTRIEVTYYTNVMCLGGMTLFFGLSGDLQIAFSYAFANPHALMLMSIYTFLAYFAITCHMILIREFGGVTTVLVGNARKAVTIALSFVLFPKPLSSLYLVGGIMVFGSLVTLAYFKEADKAKSAGAITGVGAGSGSKKGSKAAGMTPMSIGQGGKV